MGWIAVVELDEDDLVQARAHLVEDVQLEHAPQPRPVRFALQREQSLAASKIYGKRGQLRADVALVDAQPIEPVRSEGEACAKTRDRGTA
jgi:hypothetical protein